jgi:hypothetical protein
MTYQGRPQDLMGPVITSAIALGLRALIATNTASTIVSWPSANAAYLIPFNLEGPMTFAEMFWLSGTSPGTTNLDLGIYREDFTRVSSTGAIAAVNTSGIIQPAGGASLSPGPVTIGRGRYYLAMSSASALLSVRAHQPANHVCRALGMVTMASAHPLPSTITPASMGSTSFIPDIGAASITNIL